MTEDGLTKVSRVQKVGEQDTVRDGLGAKAGLSEWTGNDVNDKARQAKVEGSGL